MKLRAQISSSCSSVRPTLYRLICVVIGITFSTVVSADVLHYWRFEDTPGWLGDSIGTATLSTNGSPSQVALPSGAAGTLFPLSLSVPGGGPNAKATLENAGTLDTLLTTVAGGYADAFTIEAFVHFKNLETNFGLVIGATAASGTLPPNDFGWTLQVRRDRNQGTDQNELIIAVDDGGTGFGVIQSDTIINKDTDYYVAATFSDVADTAQFFVQDLTNGGALQVVDRSNHGLSIINEYPTFTIGYGQFNGETLYDEVRLSNTALGESELLINNATFVPIPPTVWLLMSSLAVLIRRFSSKVLSDG